MARLLTKGGWGIVIVPLLLVAGLVAFMMVADTDDVPMDDGPSLVAEVTPTFERLPPSGALHYELWERRGSGGEARLGAFRVLEGGSLVTLPGDPLVTLRIPELPPSGTDIFLTIEPGTALVETPSERVLLRGTLTTTEVELAPVVPDIPKNQVALLATPTEKNASPTAGVWFAKKSATKGSPAPGLSLPEFSGGWAYGGWVVSGVGTTLPTGIFTDSGARDRTAPYSGAEKGWNLPGEDFLRNAPDGVRFPLNLADGRTEVLVSLEPDTGDETAPATPFLPLLSLRIPFKQAANTPFVLKPVDNGTFPSGKLVFTPQSGTSE